MVLASSQRQACSQQQLFPKHLLPEWFWLFPKHGWYFLSFSHVSLFLLIVVFYVLTYLRSYVLTSQAAQCRQCLREGGHQGCRTVKHGVYRGKCMLHRVPRRLRSWGYGVDYWPDEAWIADRNAFEDQDRLCDWCPGDYRHHKAAMRLRTGNWPRIGSPSQRPRRCWGSCNTAAGPAGHNCRSFMGRGGASTSKSFLKQRVHFPSGRQPSPFLEYPVEYEHPHHKT